eukprot:COSAG02_NODE_24687_length_680_cov_1.067126_2_plen_46_part_01
MKQAAADKLQANRKSSDEKLQATAGIVADEPQPAVLASNSTADGEA